MLVIYGLSATITSFRRMQLREVLRGSGLILEQMGLRASLLEELGLRFLSILRGPTVWPGCTGKPKYTYTYVYVLLCTSWYVRTYVRTRVCAYVRTYVCMYVCIHECMYVCVCVRMYVYVYVCMCICVYVCVY